MQEQTTSLKWHKDLETLPIWNYYKIQKNNDIRYLLILDDYYNLPEIDKETKVKIAKTFKHLVEQLPKVDLTLQFYYLKYLKDTFEFQLNINTDDKNNKLRRANISFSDYRRMLDGMYENVKFGEKIFKNTKALYEYFQNDLFKGEPETLAIVRGDVFDYRAIKGEFKNKYDLIKEVVHLREIVNQHIDIFKTSVAEYHRIKIFADQKIKAQSKFTQKRKRDK